MGAAHHPRRRPRHDYQPLRSRSAGPVLFCTSLAAVIIGFLGSVPLGIHAKALKPSERLTFIAAYCLLGALLSHLAVDPVFGSLDVPFPPQVADPRAHHVHRRDALHRLQ
jgi:hypothetical protein